MSIKSKKYDLNQRQPFGSQGPYRDKLKLGRTALDNVDNKLFVI